MNFFWKELLLLWVFLRETYRNWLSLMGKLFVLLLCMAPFLLGAYFLIFPSAVDSQPVSLLPYPYVLSTDASLRGMHASQTKLSALPLNLIYALPRLLTFLFFLFSFLILLPTSPFLFLFFTPFARPYLYYSSIGVGRSRKGVVRLTYFRPSVDIPFLSCNELPSWCPVALQVSLVGLLLSTPF